MASHNAPRCFTKLLRKPVRSERETFYPLRKVFGAALQFTFSAKIPASSDQTAAVAASALLRVTPSTWSSSAVYKGRLQLSPPAFVTAQRMAVPILCLWHVIKPEILTLDSRRMTWTQPWIGFLFCSENCADLKSQSSSGLARLYKCILKRKQWKLFPGIHEILLDTFQFVFQSHKQQTDSSVLKARTSKVGVDGGGAETAPWKMYHPPLGCFLLRGNFVSPAATGAADWLHRLQFARLLLQPLRLAGSRYWWHHF